MLIGVAAGIKILPGAFILFLVLKREWGGAVLGCLAAFAVTVGLGAVFAPRDSWQFWSGGFVKVARFGPDAVIRGDNQSLTGAFMRLSHELSPPAAITLLLSLGAMTLGLVAAKHQIDSGMTSTGSCALHSGRCWPLRSRGPTIGSGPFSRYWSLYRIDVGSPQRCSLRYSWSGRCGSPHADSCSSCITTGGRRLRASRTWWSR
jgi:hypothetical protein